MRVSSNEARHDAAAMSVLAGHWVEAQPIISAFICCSVRDFHDAQDILQQVAQTATIRFHEYDPARPFVPWAIGIARHKIADHFRNGQRDKLIFDADAITSLAEAYGDMTPDLDAMKDALEHCLNKTNPRWVRVLELRYLREMKPAQIATHIGTTASTISVMLHRVREALAQCIRRRVHSEGPA